VAKRKVSINGIRVMAYDLAPPARLGGSIAGAMRTGGVGPGAGFGAPIIGMATVSCWASPGIRVGRTPMRVNRTGTGVGS